MNTQISATDQLLINEISNRFLSKTKSVLFHYSDCNSLISILSKNEFWLSNIQFMNDKQEVDNSVSIIKEAIEQSDHTDYEKDIFIKQFINNKKQSSKNMYILSLSQDRDSLNLWNNYAKNDGYNIGIDFLQLTHLITNKEIQITNKEKEPTNYSPAFGRVLYDSKEQISFFQTVFDRYVEIVTEGVNKGLNSKQIKANAYPVWNVFMLYSFLIKSSEHSIENEFRFIFQIPENSKCIDYRTRNGIVLPYIRIGSKTTLPFTEINIGPKINDDIATEGVKMVLKSNNIRIKPYSSKIKLRF